MLITRNQDIKIEKWEINAPNSVGEPGSDTEGEEIVGEDDRDSISRKRIYVSPLLHMKNVQPIPVNEGRSKGKAGCLYSAYRPKFVISRPWKKE
jgi:hypothetical protein